MPVTKTKTNAQPQKVHESEGSTPVIEPIQGEKALDYARDLAFQEEEVEVMIAPGVGDGSDTTRLVGPIAVNGTGVFLVRGEWCKIKRKYLGVLLRAKQESWTFSYVKTGDGQTKDTQFAIQSPRYTFAGVRDMNPKGALWLQQLQQQQV